jgi:hypothetical protein
VRPARLRLARRRLIDFATEEKLLALLRSRNMSAATYAAAVRMAEQELAVQKLMVDLTISHARLLLVSGAGMCVLSITALLAVRRLE